MKQNTHTHKFRNAKTALNPSTQLNANTNTDTNTLIIENSKPFIFTSTDTFTETRLGSQENLLGTC